MNKTYYDLDRDPNITEGYYDRLARSANPLQARVHQRRHEMVNRYIKKYYQPAAVVVDFACGNCSWNKERLPVTGFDRSQKMLDYSLRKGRISQGIRADITTKTSLESSSVDIAILTEILEHLVHPKTTLREVHRVLKPQGIVIITTPYDTAFSFWKPLFFLLCFYQGTILGKELYKNQCGHLQSFDPRSLKNLVESCGFKTLEQQSLARFIQILVAQKR